MKRVNVKAWSWYTGKVLLDFSFLADSSVTEKSIHKSVRSLREYYIDDLSTIEITIQ